MGKRLVIGILGVPEYNGENEAVVTLYNGYRIAVAERECIPLVISPLLSIDYYGTKLSEIPYLTEKEKETYREIVDMCDGLIIPGGYRMYDYSEYIAKYAIDKNIPVLGICLGMQLLAKIDNESYCLEENATTINHKQLNADYAHKVHIQDNTLLKEIINKDEISVNSKHRYHVAEVKNAIINAVSEDGLIEGIEFPDKNFVLGVQWHPERMIKYDEFGNKIFDRFIEECQKKG